MKMNVALSVFEARSRTTTKHESNGNDGKWKVVDTCLENAESELFSILLRHDSRRSAEFRARLLSELLTAAPLLAFPLGTYRSTGR